MCVQVWEACLSADGRPHPGGWLQRVFAPLITLALVVRLRAFSPSPPPHPLSLFVFCVLSNLRCDASCLTCVGPSWGNCSSCSGDHILLDGVCVVNTQCTEGQSTVFRLERALARRCVIKLPKL